MSLYPSLELLNQGQMAEAQIRVEQGQQGQIAGGSASGGVVAVPSAPASGSLYASLYGEFDDSEWMGMKPWQAPPQAVQAYQGGGAVAVPQQNDVVSIKQGVREVVVAKNAKGKIGLTVKSVSKGVFVSVVHRDLPAAAAGLRFGDQLLQVNGENLAGYDSKKALNTLVKAAEAGPVKIAVRDRPFERTITLVKDSTGHVGFEFRKGEIVKLRKDSSAARNGLLIDHQMTEVMGQNVVGMKDADILKILASHGNHITITIVPKVLFDHMCKSLLSATVDKRMDHSVPQV